MNLTPFAGKDDVRSSYYLEDVATEFQVQGLELDWACVVWDGDLRFNGGSWSHHEFKGTRCGIGSRRKIGRSTSRMPIAYC
jgi:hypothetical protein